jgi:hypothetical protein
MLRFVLSNSKKEHFMTRLGNYENHESVAENIKGRESFLQLLSDMFKPLKKQLQEDEKTTNSQAIKQLFDVCDSSKACNLNTSPKRAEMPDSSTVGSKIGSLQKLIDALLGCNDPRSGAILRTQARVLEQTAQSQLAKKIEAETSARKYAESAARIAADTKSRINSELQTVRENERLLTQRILQIETELKSNESSRKKTMDKSAELKPNKSSRKTTINERELAELTKLIDGQTKLLQKLKREQTEIRRQKTKLLDEEKPRQAEELRKDGEHEQNRAQRLGQEVTEILKEAVILRFAAILQAKIGNLTLESPQTRTKEITDANPSVMPDISVELGETVSELFKEVKENTILKQLVKSDILRKKTGADTDPRIPDSTSLTLEQVITNKALGDGTPAPDFFLRTKSIDSTVRAHRTSTDSTQSTFSRRTSIDMTTDESAAEKNFAWGKIIGGLFVSNIIAAAVIADFAFTGGVITAAVAACFIIFKSIQMSGANEPAKDMTSSFTR